MATSRVPVTPQGKGYKTVVDLRERFTNQRSKTRKTFDAIQKVAGEAMRYLEGVYKKRVGPGYMSDPSFVYYRNLLERMTHCHTRSHFSESIPAMISEFRRQLGANPSGDAAKLLGVLEGRLLGELNKYFGEYQKDVRLEEEFRQAESDFLEEFRDNPFPAYVAPERPTPFEYIDEDYSPPAMPRSSSSSSGLKSSELCKAPCTGHGREGKPCGVRLGSDGVCQHHGPRLSTTIGDDTTAIV